MSKELYFWSSWTQTFRYGETSNDDLRSNGKIVNHKELLILLLSNSQLPYTNIK